jgi:MFS family permease
MATGTDSAKAIFSRDFIVVSLINFLLMIAYYLMFAIFSPYMLASFSASPSTAGLATGIVLAGCLVGRFFTGGSLERHGCKKILLAGDVLCVLGTAGYLFAHDLPTLFLTRCLHGLGIGMVGTVTGTVVAKVVPMSQRGLGISYFSMSTILGMALGPFFGLLLMPKVSFNAQFAFCLGATVLSLFLAFLLREPGGGPSRKDSPVAPAPRARLENYISYQVLPIAAIVVIVCAGYSAVQAFFSFYAQENQLLTVGAFFFLIYATSTFVSRPFTGGLFDRRGENIIIYPGLLLAALALLMLGLWPAPGVVIVAGVLLGAGYGNFLSITQALAISMDIKERAGQATSTYFITLDLGLGFGPYLLGFIVPMLGYRKLYLFAAALMLLSIPLYYLLHGRKARLLRRARHLRDVRLAAAGKQAS